MRIHTTPPSNFYPCMEVSACYIEIDHTLLLLRRSLAKSQPGAWGVPGGKREGKESPLQTALRELYEETGIQLLSLLQIEPITTLFLQREKEDFIYHMFEVFLSDKPEIRITKEHMQYAWASKKELKKMPLVEGAIEVLAFRKPKTFL